MKKIFIFIIAIIICFSTTSLIACSPSNHPKYPQYDAIIKQAIVELKEGWEDLYKEFPHENRDNKIHIKNSRIVEINDAHEISEFENVKYVVDFIVYSDYYGTGGKYFMDVGLYDTVIVYKDGSIKFIEYDIIKQYISAYYDFSFSFVSQIIDLGASYNQTIILNVA